jgi:hypothetical protein
MKNKMKLSGLFAALLSTGCVGMNLGKSADIDVAACAGDADIDDTTFIVWEFEDSIHEMITCGSLTFQLIDGLLDTAQAFATGESSLPESFSYENGRYISTGQGVSMDVTFTRSVNTPGGSSGEPIEHNLFNVNSYLVNANVTDSGDGLQINFDEPGPLAPLLGMGDNPSSPLVMSAADVANFAVILGTLKLDSNIYVDHEQTLSIVQYDIDNSPSLLFSLFSNMSMDMSNATASASRIDLNQELEPTLWDIQYVDASKGLDGVIEADVTGGPFDFHAVLEYDPIFDEPDITITCLKE